MKKIIVGLFIVASMCVPTIAEETSGIAKYIPFDKADAGVMYGMNTSKLYQQFSVPVISIKDLVFGDIGYLKENGTSNGSTLVGGSVDVMKAVSLLPIGWQAKYLLSKNIFIGYGVTYDFEDHSIIHGPRAFFRFQ